MKRYFITVITVFVLVCNVVLADGIPVQAVEYSFESDTAVGESLYETGISSDGYAMGTKLTYTLSDGNESVNADVTIRSENSQEKNAVLILKAVNSNDKFYLKTMPVKIAANGDTSAEISLNGLENTADGYRWSLYLWDAFNTLKPLTKSLTIPQNSDTMFDVSVSVRTGAALSQVKLLDTLVAAVSTNTKTAYQWQISRDDGASWTDIADATSTEYIVSATEAGAKVRCAVTEDGYMYAASTAVQIPMYEAAKTGDGTAVPEGTIDTTANADKFTVDGKEFVLLDTFDNDESTYYVTTTDAYGDMQLKTAGEWWTLSGKEINYDAYNAVAFLNGKFLTDGNNFTALGNDTTTYYKLPQGIIDNINQNHVWWRFVNDTRKKEGVKSTYQAGVSFLSWTDFTTYAGKLGAVDGFLNSDALKVSDALKDDTLKADTYFLRDTNNWGGDSALAVFCTADKKCMHWGQGARPYGLVRPAFYLKKEFFKTTKIDLATMGENVRTAIREACTDEELKKLYTEEECEDYFGIVRPLRVKTTVRSGKLLENVELLDTLTASLNKNVAADYRWQVSRNNGASWTDINGETSAEHIVSAAEAGAKVRCTVTVDANAVSGEAVQIPNLDVKTPEAVNLDAFAEGAPNEFCFEVDGKTFVLLDTFDNDKSAYYVTTVDAYGDMQTITNGAIPVGKKINYDAYKSDEFLNGDFLTKGNNFTALGNDTTTYYKLPQGIIDNINKNHVWWRFVNDYRKKNGVQSTYKTGVSLLSWTDFSAYAQRIGQLDVFNDANVKDAEVMFLRDTNNWGGSSAVTVFGTGKYEKKCIYVENQSETPYGLLRPAFYLKKDFFRTVKLDLSQTGESVLNVIRGRYCIEDLIGIYTEQELTENGFRRRGETNGNTLDIESIAVGNVFTDAEDAKIRIHSSSPVVCYRITDYDDKVVKSGTANTVYDFAELNFNSLDVGYYELSVQNGDNFNDSAEKKNTSLAIVPEYDFSQVTNSPFGINTHFELNWLGWDIKTISLLKKAGVKSVRDGYEWHSMESEVKGEYKNYNFFPYEQARLRQAGIDYLYVAGSYNKFYDNDASPYTDEGMQGLANYAKKAAELYNYQYGDYKLKYMEMYNEWYTAAGDKGDGPADSSPENYIKVFRKMYETVKAAYPNMTMFLNIYPQETNSEGLLKLGGLNYCDGYAIHHYNYSLNKEDPENLECGLGITIDKTQDMIAKYNTNNKEMKFWLSEFGWPSVSAPDWGVQITEKEQAEYLVRGFAVALSKGMERVYWYDFMNDRDRDHIYEDDCESHKKNGEYNYGLIRNGFDRTYGAHTPKRSYVAYANITRELANKSFVRVDKADDGVGAVYHYHFEGAGGKTAIAYYAVLDGSEEKPSKSITLTANESVVVKNIEGKTLKIASAGEDITLTLSSAPIYIEGGYTVKQ